MQIYKQSRRVPQGLTLRRFTHSGYTDDIKRVAETHDDVQLFDLFAVISAAG
jgi:hypothetical protein